MGYALSAPIKLNSRTAQSRLVLNPHSTGIRFGDTSSLRQYYGERASGGVGTVILGVAGVHEISPSSIPVNSDEVIPSYRALADEVHAHGSLLIQQLWHAGPARFLGRRQPMSASIAANPLVGVGPKPMSSSEIEELVECYEASARRVYCGGLDGVEVHAAHGYLLAEFLSSATNHREDAYGGPIKNRTRIVVDALAAARRGIGPEGIVGVRLSARDDVPGGMTPSLAAEIAAILEPYVDYINVSTGSYHRYHRIFATSDSPLGYQLDDSRVVTAAVRAPTIVSGRIMDVGTAERVVMNNDADLVGMVRPLIADPMAASLAPERPVRPCIGTNEGCVGQFLERGEIRCSVNPEVIPQAESIERQGQTSVPASRIVVAGAGPAGLEAARVLAEAGHNVVILERAQHIGGQLAIGAKATNRHDFGALIDWYGQEIDRLGIDVKLRRIAEPDSLYAVKPDAVVIATGSEPHLARPLTMAPSVPVPGHEHPHVYSTWQVLSDASLFLPTSDGPSSRVFIYDDVGQYEALSVVDELLARGCHVTYATRNDRPGAAVPAPMVTVYPVLERMVTANVRIMTNCHITLISEDDVEVDFMLGSHLERLAVDAVILAGMNRTLCDNADLLSAATVPIEVAGDATGTRTIRHAIEGGSRVAKTLEKRLTGGAARL